MTHYAINISPPPASSHRFLIGPPLFVVSLFCFAFVLMQPHNPAQAKTAAASQAAAGSFSNKPSLSQPSQTTLPKLSQEPVMPSPTPVTASATASASSSALSTTSQAAGSAATTSLQSAKPNNNQTAGNQLKINLNNVTNVDLFK